MLHDKQQLAYNAEEQHANSKNCCASHQ